MPVFSQPERERLCVIPSLLLIMLFLPSLFCQIPEPLKHQATKEPGHLLLSPRQKMVFT